MLIFISELFKKKIINLNIFKDACMHGCRRWCDVLSWHDKLGFRENCWMRGRSLIGVCLKIIFNCFPWMWGLVKWSCQEALSLCYKNILNLFIMILFLSFSTWSKKSLFFKPSILSSCKLFYLPKKKNLQACMKILRNSHSVKNMLHIKFILDGNF